MKTKWQTNKLIRILLITAILNQVGKEKYAFSAPPKDQPKVVKKSSDEGSSEFGSKNDLSSDLSTKEMDQLALTAKKKSVATLIQLAKQRANTPEEDIILSRVAENLLGCASIEFRLAARIGSIKKKPTDFREFHNYLNQAVFYLTKIVKDNPSGDLLARAHYLRGKAYKELKKFKDASNDFKLVVDRFPNAPDANFACLALADILFDARDYKQNIYYLNKLVEYKGSTYGMALDRLALVHYVIDDIGSAIKYIKMEVAYIEKNPDAPGAENKEKALNSAAQFYATAIQKHTPGYDVLGAIRLFKTLDKSADISKPLILFTNILRTKGFENELEEIKGYVVKGEVDPLVAANVVNSIFDFQLNRRQYGKVKQTITEIDGLITKLVDRGEKPENINKIRRDLANAITMVQKDFTENKDKSEGPTIGATLVILYNYSIKSSQDDPTFKIKAAYNLAETYYMMKKYKDAASYYQWIVQNASFATKEDKKLIEDAELKYLTARYEEVRVAQLFPKNLNAISLNKNDPKTIPDLAKDWIKALDMSHDKFNSFKGFDQMNFEANRLIYSYGHIEEAIDRFKTFITKYPESEFAMASASLVIDTYIATEDWKKTYDVAYYFMKQKKWKSNDFPEKLTQIAGDSYYKTLEGLYKNKDYKAVLKYIDVFATKFPKNKNIAAGLNLAANSSIALGDNKSAMLWHSKIEKSGGMTVQMKSTAVLNAATVFEEQLQFENAGKAYRDYIATGNKSGFSDAEMQVIKKKALIYTWVSGDNKELEKSMPSICDSKLEEECERTKLLTQLTTNQTLDDKTMRKEYFRSMKGFPSTRVVRSLILLKKPEIFTYEERKKLLENLEEHWGSLDAFAQYTSLPYLTQVIPNNFSFIRRQTKALAKIKFDPSAIKKRVKLVEETEKFFTKFLDISWVNVKTTALNELANLYTDMTIEIDSLPKPKGMNEEENKQYNATIAEVKDPFIKKTTEYRGKAFEIATNSNTDSGITESVLAAYFSENPEIAKKYEPRNTSPEGLEAQFRATKESLKSIPMISAELEKINKEDKSKKESKIISNEEVRNHFIKTTQEALEKRNWPKIALLLQEGSRRKVVEDVVLNTYKGYSLIFANARSEGLPLLADSISQLDRDSQIRININLMIASYEAFDKEKTLKHLEQFFSWDGHRRPGNGLNATLGKVIQDIVQWTGYSATQDTLMQLSSFPNQSNKEPRNPASSRGKK